MKLTFLISFILLIFSACAQHGSKVSQFREPSWINNPNQNNHTGSIGIAHIHHKGFVYQRKLAISRALDELALQQGVLVSLDMQKTEKIKNNTLSTNTKVETSYTTTQSTLNAYIKDTWQDPSSKTFYVWLVLY